MNHEAGRLQDLWYQQTLHALRLLPVSHYVLLDLPALQASDPPNKMWMTMVLPALDWQLNTNVRHYQSSTVIIINRTMQMTENVLCKTSISRYLTCGFKYNFCSKPKVKNFINSPGRAYRKTTLEIPICTMGHRAAHCYCNGQRCLAFSADGDEK